MSEVTEVFKHDGFGHKLGPLPVWAWALLIAVGAFVVYRWQQGSSSSSAGSPTLGDATSYPAYSDSGDSTGSGGGSYYDNTGGSSTSGSGYTDNQSWLNAALGESSSFGSSATSLNSALQAFLNGQPLTQDQSNLVNSVVGSLGAPPTGTLGASTVTPNTPAAPAAPTTYALNGTNFASSILSKDSKGNVTAFTVTNKQTGKQVLFSSNTFNTNGHGDVNSGYNYVQNLLVGGNHATTQTAGGVANNLLKSIGGA